MRLLVFLTLVVALGGSAFALEPDLGDVVSVDLEGQTLIFRRLRPARDGIDYPDFLLLETEVTNALYRAFLLATHGRKDDAEALRIVEERKKTMSFSTGDVPIAVDDPATIWRDGTFPAGLEEHPVALVTVPEAAAYCAWLSQRLPTLGLLRLPTWNEWMIAAYGRSRQYPWGDEWTSERVHAAFGMSFADAAQRAEPVRARPGGQTPNGLYGMLGNVSEYIVTGDAASDDYFNLGAQWMGGGYQDGWAIGKAIDRPMPRNDYWGYSHHATMQSSEVGFRVLLDVNRDPNLLRRPRIFQQRNRAWSSAPVNDVPITE